MPQFLPFEIATEDSLGLCEFYPAKRENKRRYGEKHE